MTMGLGRLGAGFGRLGTFRSGGAFDPIGDLFSDGTDGYWFRDADWTRLASSGLARLYTDVIGTTAATAVTNSIALMLEEHSGAALGAELLGTGALSTTGTPPSPATYNTTTGAGTAHRTDASNQAGVLFSGLTSTKFYRFLIETTSASGLIVRAGNITGPAIYSSSGVTGQVQVVITGVAGIAITFNGASGSCAFTVHSLKEVSGNHGRQSTSGSRPTIQETGGRKLLRFDALDDCFLTPFLAQNGPNSIVAKVTVPASLAATQVIAGASGASANRCFLAVNTSGQLCAGVGSDSTTTIVGTTDLRGLTVAVGLTFDGSTVKLFVDEDEEYSAPQNGTPTTTQPLYYGALNNNGTAGSFFGGDGWHGLAFRKARTLAQYLAIRSQMNAA